MLTGELKYFSTFVAPYCENKELPFVLYDYLTFVLPFCFS